MGFIVHIKILLQSYRLFLKMLKKQKKTVIKTKSIIEMLFYIESRYFSLLIYSFAHYLGYIFQKRYNVWIVHSLGSDKPDGAGG